MIRRLRILFFEVLAVAIPAAVVLMSHPTEYGFARTAGLIACVLLPLRLLWPPLALLACLPALAGGLGWAPAVVAMYRIGHKSRRVRIVVAWVVVAVLSSSLPVIVPQDLLWSDSVLAVCFTVLTAGAPAALGALVRLRRELTASLVEVRRAREAELDARMDGARAEERARIAREIHDAVGHHATLIAVQSAALAATTTDPAAKRTAQQLRELAKESLGEMRAALGLLNTDRRTPHGLNHLPDLVDRARRAGLTVTLTDRHGEDEPYAPVGRAVYRVVQEALTNAAKHAPGATVEVLVGRDGPKITVSVVNGPALLPGAPPDTGGAGLEGLSERVATAGGTLRTEALLDGGFAVSAAMPAHLPTPTKVGTSHSTIGGSDGAVATP